MHGLRLVGATPSASSDNQARPAIVFQNPPCTPDRQSVNSTSRRWSREFCFPVTVFCSEPQQLKPPNSQPVHRQPRLLNWNLSPPSSQTRPPNPNRSTCSVLKRKRHRNRARHPNNRPSLRRPPRPVLLSRKSPMSCHPARPARKLRLIHFYRRNLFRHVLSLLKRLRSN